MVVLDFHEAGAGQGDAEFFLSGGKGGDALDGERGDGGLDAEDRRLAVLKRPVVNDEGGGAEIDVRPDGGDLRAAPDVVGLAIAGLDREPLVGGDNGRLVIGLAVADGAELLVGHKAAGLGQGGNRTGKEQCNGFHGVNYIIVLVFSYLFFLPHFAIFFHMRLATYD